MSDLFVGFSQANRQILSTAKKIAKKHQQSIINTDHLLLSVLQQANQPIESGLRRLNVSVEDLAKRLEATMLVVAKQNQTETNIGYTDRNVTLSVEAKRIVDEAIAEGFEQNNSPLEPTALIVGMLRDGQNSGAGLLHQYGITLSSFRQALSSEDLLERYPPLPEPTIRSGNSRLPIQLSPIFVGLIVIMGVSAYLLYRGSGNTRIALFFFVISGWVASVAIHEFGHALVAYLGGDTSVVDRGYLTLDPLKYTHPFLSIALPVIFLIMGGIGLPGGAVYIQPGAIRSTWMRALTSAAGPIASAICAFLFAIPLFYVWDDVTLLSTYIELWAGLGLLVFLEITAICLNLLPIPGLDGFGIIEPYLPREFLERFNVIRPFSFFILYGLLFMDTPIRDSFWSSVWQAAAWVHPELGFLVSMGFQMFRFWSN